MVGLTFIVYLSFDRKIELGYFHVLFWSRSAVEYGGPTWAAQAATRQLLAWADAQRQILRRQET